jgi:excisionase family DNA binding protein
MSSNIKVQRICQFCGNQFTAKTTVTRYCSDPCRKSAYKASVMGVKIESSNKETNRIKNQPIEVLNAKAFLSIAETCKLVGISRRTVYRMIDRGELNIGKAGKRSIIRRSDLELLLFEQPQTTKPQTEIIPEQTRFDISECYNLKEVQSKFGISDKALHEIIKRNSIPKIKKGWFAYVPKTIIDTLLS